MARLKSACYCWSLRTGTLIIGWLSLIASFVFILVATFLIKPALDEPSKYDNEYIGKAFDLFILLVIYAVMGLNIISDIALLYGAYQDRNLFLVPYLVSNGIMLVCIIWIFIESVLKQASVLYIIYWIVFAVGTGYFLAVVWGYFAELRSQRNQADVMYTTTNTTDRKNVNSAEEGLME